MARFGGVLKKLIAASTVEDIEDDEDANSKYVGTPSNNMDGDSDDLTPLRMRSHSFNNGTPSRQGSRNVGGEIDFSAGEPLGDDFEGERIYAKGVSCDYFTLILQGKVTVHAGSDDFESELGPWCYVGQKALTADPFVPDFRAHSHGSVRLLKIRRGDYKAAMRAAQVEAMSGSRSVAGSRHAAAGDSPDLSATVSPHGVSRNRRRSAWDQARSLSTFLDRRRRPRRCRRGRRREVEKLISTTRARVSTMTNRNA